MSEATDRAVRKALLQARAEVERIELARQVAEVREAVTPRALLQQVLPTSLARRLSGEGGHRQPGRSLGTEVAHQVTAFYNRYPLVWSTVASFVFRRTRFSRMFRLLGFALATQRAFRLSKAGRR